MQELDVIDVNVPNSSKTLMSPTDVSTIMP